MLGILLIYWIGKKFYVLAERYNRSPWGWAFGGLGIFYGTQFLLGIILTIIFPDAMNNLDKSGETILNIVGLVLGLGIWYAALSYFEKKWDNESYDIMSNLDEDISSIGKDLEA